MQVLAAMCGYRIYGGFKLHCAMQACMPAEKETGRVGHTISGLHIVVGRAGSWGAPAQISISPPYCGYLAYLKTPAPAVTPLRLLVQTASSNQVANVCML